MKIISVTLSGYELYELCMLLQCILCFKGSLMCENRDIISKQVKYNNMLKNIIIINTLHVIFTY